MNQLHSENEQRFIDLAAGLALSLVNARHDTMRKHPSPMRTTRGCATAATVL